MSSTAPDPLQLMEKLSLEETRILSPTSKEIAHKLLARSQKEHEELQQLYAKLQKKREYAMKEINTRLANLDVDTGIDSRSRIIMHFQHLPEFEDTKINFRLTDAELALLQEVISKDIIDARWVLGGVLVRYGIRNSLEFDIWFRVPGKDKMQRLKEMFGDGQDSS